MCNFLLFQKTHFAFVSLLAITSKYSTIPLCAAFTEHLWQEICKFFKQHFVQDFSKFLIASFLEKLLYCFSIHLSSNLVILSLPFLFSLSVLITLVKIKGFDYIFLCLFFIDIGRNIFFYIRCH